MPAAKDRVAGQPPDDGTVLRGITHHAALTDRLATRLELRLHERDGFSDPLEDAEHRREYLLQRDEGDVDDGERRLVTKDPRVEPASVRVLHYDDTVVTPKFVVQLT